MDIFEELGVPKAINAWGHITIRGGAKLPPEVVQAMAEASKVFVDIFEFKAAVGRRIAELTHNEACEVCCGAAAGCILSTAACIAGTDPGAMAKIPMLDGLKNEVVIFRSQFNPYCYTIQRAGVTLREVGTIRGTQPWQLKNAIGPQTAAVFFFVADFYNRGANLTLEKTIEIAHASGVPVIVDAASNLPPVENLWSFTQMGADLAIFSGGKGLQGPQPSGLIVGRKGLVAACTFANGPNHTIGRSMKVGKEELAGLLAAVKRFVNLDHGAVRERWERQVEYMIAELSGIPGVHPEYSPTGESGVACPRVRVEIDQKALRRTMSEILQSLRSGDPWVIVGPSSVLAGPAVDESAPGFFLNPQTLDEGEEKLVVTRLRQAFGVA